MNKRRLFLGAFAVAILWLVVVAMVTPILQGRFIGRVRAIPIGASREYVKEQLGLPRQRFARGNQLIDHIAKPTVLLRLLIPESPETWAYGTPFAIRPFGPREDDILIEFDRRGLVQSVVIPEP